MKASSQNTQVNIVDILLYLLRNWYWFLLCIGISVAFAYYKYTQLPFVYRSDATVIIKDPSNVGTSRTTSGLNNYSNLVNRVNMTNEILQLRSNNLMSEVVRTLDADINYSFKDRLRTVELYRRTPVRMFFDRSDEQFSSFSAKIIPVDEHTFRLVRTDLEGDEQLVTLGDTISVDGHRMVFKPTSNYRPYFYGKEIVLRKYPVQSAAASYVGRMSVTQGDGSILKIFIQDAEPNRARDILNTLID